MLPHASLSSAWHQVWMCTPLCTWRLGVPGWGRMPCVCSLAVPCGQGVTQNTVAIKRKAAAAQVPMERNADGDREGRILEHGNATHTGPEAALPTPVLHSHPHNSPSFWAFLSFPSKAKTTGTFLPSFSKAASCMSQRGEPWAARRSGGNEGLG